jgi:hypothetical protein
MTLHMIRRAFGENLNVFRCKPCGYSTTEPVSWTAPSPGTTIGKACYSGYTGREAPSAMSVLINGFFRHIGLERKSPLRNCGSKLRRAIAAVSIRPTNAAADRSTNYHTLRQYEGAHNSKPGSMAK